MSQRLSPLELEPPGVQRQAVMAAWKATPSKDSKEWMDKQTAKQSASSSESKQDGSPDEIARKKSRKNTQGAATVKGDTGEVADDDANMSDVPIGPQLPAKGRGKGKGRRLT